MKKVVYLDFDGTLVNCENRLYGLFSEMIAPRSIEKERYWKLRGSGARQKDILQQQLGYNDAACAQFAEEWLRKIELEMWLALDRPRVDAEKILSVLTVEYNLILVTHRQSREGLLREVKRMGFGSCFTGILVTEQTQSKESLIRSVHTGQGVLVGDTCEDVRTACALDIPSVIIRSEFEQWEQILSYHPSVTISNLSQLPLALREAFSQ